MGRREVSCALEDALFGVSPRNPTILEGVPDDGSELVPEAGFSFGGGFVQDILFGMAFAVFPLGVSPACQNHSFFSFPDGFLCGQGQKRDGKEFKIHAHPFVVASGWVLNPVHGWSRFKLEDLLYGFRPTGSIRRDGLGVGASAHDLETFVNSFGEGSVGVGGRVEKVGGGEEWVGDGEDFVFVVCAEKCFFGFSFAVIRHIGEEGDFATHTGE